MTCIAAVTHKGHTYLGGDACVSSGELLSILRGPKVWVTPSGWAIGCAGDFTWSDVVSRVDLPKDPTEITRVVADALQRRYGAKLDGEHAPDGCALLGRGGLLWALEPDGAMVAVGDDYAAVGSGADVALGALGALAKRSPKYRIHQALTLAERHTPFVRAPFSLVVA